MEFLLTREVVQDPGNLLGERDTYRDLGLPCLRVFQVIYSVFLKQDTFSIYQLRSCALENGMFVSAELKTMMPFGWIFGSADLRPHHFLQ